MAKKVISIEISRTYMRGCEVDYKAKNPVVHQVFTVPTPEGAYDDGFITETDKFGQYIKQVLTENGIKSKSIVFSVNSSRIANREALIPFVKEKQIAQVVKANASDYFPVDISSYQLAHSILDTVENDGQKQYKLLVLAAPRAMLESYYILAKKAGLTIEAIDYSGNSIIPIVKHALTSEPSMIIKVEEHSTLVTVMKDRAVVLQRNINTGASVAIDAVRENDAFGVGISYEKAIDLLREKPLIRRSFDGATPDESDDRNDSAIYHEAKVDLTDALRGLVSSIVRVVDYYNSRNADEPITRYIMTGFGGDFNGFAKLLTHEIDQRVIVLSHVDGVSLDRKIMASKIYFGEYIACIGATFEPVNLLLTDAKKIGQGEKKGGDSLLTMDLSDIKTDQLCVILFVVGMMAAIGLGGYAFYTHYQAETTNKQLEARVKQLEPIELVYTDYNNSVSLYTDAVALYDLTQNNNENIVAFIKELEEKLPSAIAVESMQSDSSVVALSMQVANEATIGEVLEELRTFESLKDVQFTGSSKSTNDAGQEVWDMTVVCYYNDMPSLMEEDADEETTEEGEEASEETAETEETSEEAAETEETSEETAEEETEETEENAEEENSEEAEETSEETTEETANDAE